jgi:hypothetical protein
MDYNEALDYLIKKGVTAYELHIYSGKSQSGLRKLLNGEVQKPGRKTKEVIVTYAKKLQNEEDSVDYKGNLNVEEVEQFVIQNKDSFFDREKMKELLENYLSIEIVKISRDPELFKKYFK